MPIAPTNPCARYWQHCVNWAREACGAAPAQQSARRRNSLELALRPQPRALAAGVLYTLLALAHALELLMQRNGWWSFMVFGCSVLAAVTIWRWQSVRCETLRLELRGDGTVRLAAGNGRWLHAAVQPHSLRLGRHWLLVVITEEGLQLRLWVGPGNLQGAEWAALGRWLRRPPADPFRLR